MRNPVTARSRPRPPAAELLAAALAAAFLLLGCFPLAAEDKAGPGPAQERIHSLLSRFLASPSARLRAELAALAPSLAESQRQPHRKILQFCDETLRLKEKPGSDEIIFARAQGLFWFFHHQNDSTLAMLVFETLNKPASRDKLTEQIKEAAQKSSEKRAAAAALMPRLRQALAQNNHREVQDLLEKHRRLDLNAPDLLSFQQSYDTLTLSARQRLSDMEQAYRNQDFQAVERLAAAHEAAAQTNTILEASLPEARELRRMALSRITQSSELARKAGVLAEKRLWVDAGETATEALALWPSNSTASQVLSLAGANHQNYRALLLEASRLADRRLYSEAAPVYRQLAQDFSSSRRDEFLAKAREMEQLAARRDEKLSLLETALERKNFSAAWQILKEWGTPEEVETHAEHLGAGLEIQGLDNEAYALYRLAGMERKAADLRTRKGATLQIFDAAAIAEKFRDSVVLIIAGDKGSVRTGTGFFISDKGHLVTNHHVVKGTTNLRVQRSPGSPPVPASLVESATREGSDLAVLKVDVPSAPFFAIGGSSPPAVGDTVFSIGNPMGTDRIVTQGRIAGFQKVPELDVAVIVNDIAVDSGSSGGPLLNDRGEVIGINTLSALGSQKIGLMIDIREVKSLLRPFANRVN